DPTADRNHLDPRCRRESELTGGWESISGSASGHKLNLEKRRPGEERACPPLLFPRLGTAKSVLLLPRRLSWSRAGKVLCHGRAQGRQGCRPLWHDCASVRSNQRPSELGLTPVVEAPDD